jgi:hypothetical protein
MGYGRLLMQRRKRSLQKNNAEISAVKVVSQKTAPSDRNMHRKRAKNWHTDASWIQSEGE